MKHHVKRKAKIIRQYAIGWPLGLMVFVIFRSVGTTEEGSFDPSLSESIALAGGIGLLFGVISGLFQYQIEEKLYRKASLRKIAFLKLIYLVFFVMLMIIFAFFTTNLLFDHQTTLREFAFDAGSGIIYLYVILYDTFMFMLRQINLMLGEGNLKRMFMGEFYEPHEEERVFMFIDLQSSTQIAEELGHIKYSQLLQDCFNDLGVTSKYYAQIYQYVGDEAVLTWSLDRGIQSENCLDAFYAFKQQIIDRSSYYQVKYGHVPFFKAGLHCGLITVTEVGKYKREIAYHGDTINTAARIQAKCNEYGVELLVSEELYESLSKERYQFDDKGCVELKGKKKRIELYEVRQKR